MCVDGQQQFASLRQHNCSQLPDALNCLNNLNDPDDGE
jgi:hypothetical protein